MKRRKVFPKGSKIVRGRGGDDGGNNKSAVEDPNTLFSKQIIRIVDLICEGEIEGLINGDESVYLNEVKVFDGVTSSVPNYATQYERSTRNGTQEQTYITDFSDIESDTSISQELRVTPLGDIVREITDPNVTKVRVTFMLPQMTEVDKDTGDTHGSKIQVQVYLQPDGGSYSKVLDITKKGKCTNPYEFKGEFELTGDAPWNVKIVRVTGDSTSGFISNKTYVQAITEIIESKLRYPNSALIAIKVNAEMFDQVPSRFYDIKGLLVKIPSNYNPTTRAYSGSWDGDFDIAWTNNPAWVFYDLLTNTRYGLGKYISEDQVDKWGLYEISQYCDELVDDGFGGQEPRFTCNVVLQDRADAYTVLQHLASVFRGMIYWAAGAVTATQDSPRDAVALYTAANVLEGRFIYQGASQRVRHTVALVTWNDPADFYRQRVEYVEDVDGVIRYGVQQTEVIAYGCTSRGQAHRFGKWLLYTEQHESEGVSFKTGLDGMVVRPGQVIKIADPAKAGVRMGGRIGQGSTTTHVVVDQIPAGSVAGFTLAMMLPDGTVEERTVIGSVGNTLEVQPEFSQVPNAQSIWLVRSDDVEAQTFRVVSIAEESAGVFTITAIRHNPDKFDAIEEDIKLEDRDYSALKEQPESPSNLVISESLYLTGSEVKAKVTISWDRVDRAKSYKVKYQRDNENWVEMPETSVHEADVLDALPGNYTFQVYALNSFGVTSSVSSVSGETFGKLTPPTDVDGFSMMPVAGKALLTWNQATDLDVLIGGRVRIRHSPETTGATWATSIDIVPAVPGTATSVVAPLLEGSYLAKFVDSTGHYSLEEVLIETTVPYINALNVVHTETEDPTFPGTLSNMEFVPSENAIALGSGTLVDDLPLIDDVFSWDFPGDVVTEGSYEFANTIDLGGVWPSRIISRVQVESFDIANDIDSREDLVDDWEDLDGAFLNDVNATLYVRTTEDDPSSSPTWTEWKRISAGEYLARGFQFKIIATSDTDTHNIYIRGLEITIDMADRTEAESSIASGAGTKSVTFPYAFYAAPSVGVTVNNLNTGDYSTITNVTATGFDVVFKNSGGSAVNRNFSYQAKGYGRKTA